MRSLSKIVSDILESSHCIPRDLREEAEEALAELSERMGRVSSMAKERTGRPEHVATLRARELFEANQWMTTKELSEQAGCSISVAWRVRAGKR